MDKKKIYIGANSFLSIQDCITALTSKKVGITKDSAPLMATSQQFLHEEILKRKKIYGLNTQFGDQRTYIDPHLNSQDLEIYLTSIYQRQLSLIRSHNCGMGPLVSPKIVKLTMLLRAHCLAQGYSGVRYDLIETLLQWFKSDYTPVAYKYGSIGASGDLIPLASIAAAVVGEPVQVHFNDTLVPVTSAKISAYQVQNREGLALINGTSFMSAISILAFYDLERLFKQMLHIMGMILDVLHVNPQAYTLLVHELKRHTGSIDICKMLAPYFEKELPEAYFDLQNFYSLRSICQGFGPFLENLARCKAMLEQELNAINDNPSIDAKHQRILHGANFMGYYITQVCDTLKMDIAQASTWAHSLLAILYHPRKNADLPVNLMQQTEIYSGFRPLQLLAAALAVENRKLAQSHQAFMLPTEGDNQDVNSLGTHAAFDFATAVENLERLCAVLYLSAAQAVDFRDADTLSPSTKKLHALLRKNIAFRTTDMMFKEDLDKIVLLLREADFEGVLHAKA